MGKGSATSQANFGRETTDTNTQQASTGSGDYTKQASFDPRADTLLSSLQNYGNTELNQPGGVNPFAQQVVDSQDKLANTDFKNRLAGIKSSGYGGGIGSDLIKQGMFTSDFTGRQHANDAQTLLGAFNDSNTQKNTVANGALQLLSLLRGETGTNSQAANTDTVSEGVKKTQQYNNQISASGSF